MSLTPRQEVVYALRSPAGELRHFIGLRQRQALLKLLDGEEAEGFVEILQRVLKTVREMPQTYDQDGLGMKAIVHLHYFGGAADFFITEKDKSAPEDDGHHHQAFGWASLFGVKCDGELGYISIPELLDSNLELDLHWTPKTLEEAIK